MFVLDFEFSVNIYYKYIFEFRLSCYCCALIFVFGLFIPAFHSLFFIFASALDLY